MKSAIKNSFSRTISLLLLGGLASATGAGENGIKNRETVLDRAVHIEKNLQEIPEVPPLCDSFKGQKQRINVGGCELYCEMEGQGTPLVLINGGPGGTHHGFHPCFSRAAEFAKVVYYDQRGCGISDYKKGDGYTADQAVNDLDALRAALKIDKWIVLGWSYGGFLAQHYAVKYPERVAGMALVSARCALPLSPGKSRQGEFLSNEEIKRIGEIRQIKDLPLEKLVYNTHLNGDWKRQSFYRPTTEQLARMARYEWKHDPVFRNEISRTIRPAGPRGTFDKCPIPILIMEGKMDLTWNTDKPEKFQKCFPGSKLTMFERSAHAPFEDEPGAFFASLRDFVQNLPKVTDAAASQWKEAVAEQKRMEEENDRKVSQEITFRTAEKAPANFVAWTFFWQAPGTCEGAKLSVLVRDEDKNVCDQTKKPFLLSAGEKIRSDFRKEYTGKDPKDLWGKDITFTIRVTKGKMEFPPEAGFYFEFRDENNQPIKKINALRETGPQEKP
ncbi:MAG: alpha/beta hydrolase [Verrucomicrobiae bacterium]|nr:alpha/beta hydrolase [Verrucomicrobiae bacterium]